MLADFQPFPDTTKQKCKHCSLVFQAILNTPLKQWGGSQWGCQARKKQKLIMKTPVRLKIRREIVKHFKVPAPLEQKMMEQYTK